MLKALIYSAMVYLLPPSAQARSALRESADEAMARYASIAEDIAAVVTEEGEEPLFRGPAGREATGLLLAVVAWRESGFRKDVETCQGSRSKGDEGRSIGLLQVTRARNYEGHSAEEICQDRKLALRLGLHVLRRAKETCTSTFPKSWIRSYSSGWCKSDTVSARTVCAALERSGARHFHGLSCSADGPVSLRQISQATEG